MNRRHTVFNNARPGRLYLHTPKSIRLNELGDVIANVGISLSIITWSKTWEFPIIDITANILFSITWPMPCYWKHWGIPCKRKHEEFPDDGYMAYRVMMITWDGGYVLEA